MTLRFFTPPARPGNEADRLARLRSRHLLDTPPDPVLDGIVKAAAAIFGAPIGLVSLIDADRQWFKAKSGLDAPQTPRAISFCGHAILEPEPFVVLDSRSDTRFAGNPLVVGDPTVIFYVGVPLITADGHAIGTLCIIDHQPRGDIEPAQLLAAKALAARAIAHIEAAAAAMP